MQRWRTDATQQQPSQLGRLHPSAECRLLCTPLRNTLQRAAACGKVDQDS